MGWADDGRRMASNARTTRARSQRRTRRYTRSRSSRLGYPWNIQHPVKAGNAKDYPRNVALTLRLKPTSWEGRVGGGERGEERKVRRKTHNIRGLPCRFTNTKLNKYNWTKQLSKKLTEQKSIDQTNHPTKINWSKSYWTKTLLIKILAEQITIEQLINWHLFSCQEGT